MNCAYNFRVPKRSLQAALNTSLDSPVISASDITTNSEGIGSYNTSGSSLASSELLKPTSAEQPSCDCTSTEQQFSNLWSSSVDPQLSSTVDQFSNGSNMQPKCIYIQEPSVLDSSQETIIYDFDLKIPLATQRKEGISFTNGEDEEKSQFSPYPCEVFNDLYNQLKGEQAVADTAEKFSELAASYGVTTLFTAEEARETNKFCLNSSNCDPLAEHLPVDSISTERNTCPQKDCHPHLDTEHLTDEHRSNESDMDKKNCVELDTKDRDSLKELSRQDDSQQRKMVTKDHVMPAGELDRNDGACSTTLNRRDSVHLNEMDRKKSLHSDPSTLDINRSESVCLRKLAGKDKVHRRKLSRKCSELHTLNKDDNEQRCDQNRNNEIVQEIDGSPNIPLAMQADSVKSDEFGRTYSEHMCELGKDKMTPSKGVASPTIPTIYISSDEAYDSDTSGVFNETSDSIKLPKQVQRSHAAIDKLPQISSMEYYNSSKRQSAPMDTVPNTVKDRNFSQDIPTGKSDKDSHSRAASLSNFQAMRTKIWQEQILAVKNRPVVSREKSSVVPKIKNQQIQKKNASTKDKRTRETKELSHVRDKLAQNKEILRRKLSKKEDQKQRRGRPRKILLQETKLTCKTTHIVKDSNKTFKEKLKDKRQSSNKHDHRKDSKLLSLQKNKENPGNEVEISSSNKRKKSFASLGKAQQIKLLKQSKTSAAKTSATGAKTTSKVARLNDTVIATKNFDALSSLEQQAKITVGPAIPERVGVFLEKENPVHVGGVWKSIVFE